MAGLTPDDHAIVTEAVRQAELHTSGEIVTVVADRSDGYADIALAWGAFASFTVLTLLVVFPEPPLRFYEGLHGTWNAQWLPADVFGVAAAIAILAFFATVLALLRDSLRFALVPGRIKSMRVEDRAIDLFKVGAERRTHGKTGVLIYLSLREHRAEIVADEAISGKVAPEVWGVAMADMLAEIRHGRLGHGIAAGVRDVGAVLAEHFPRSEDDTNELPDRLIEL
jgi:putative membrane protein